jgi:hypothetical protein
MHVIIPVTGVSGLPSLITSTVFGIEGLPVCFIIISIIRAAEFADVLRGLCPVRVKEETAASNKQITDKVFIWLFDLVL